MDTVQLYVLMEGSAVPVRADSIEVLVEEAVAVEAQYSGVLQALTCVGGTWDDLFAELERRARPMLDAGWLLLSTEHEESWKYGGSVFYDLERDGVSVELKYYEHGQLVAYPLFEEVGDGDVSEPIFSIYDSTLESALREFPAHGFVTGLRGPMPTGRDAGLHTDATLHQTESSPASLSAMRLSRSATRPTIRPFADLA